MIVGLILASAFLHALWNALLKRELAKDVAGVAVVGVAALAALAVALGEAILSDRAPFPGGRGLPFSVAAGCFEAGYFTTLVLALERAPLGIAYTVSRGAAILLVWPVSVLLLGEAVTPLAMGGTVLLFGGVVACGFTRGAGLQRGFGLACLCGVFIAGYHLCYKRAMSVEPSASAVFAVSLAVALPLQIARLGAGRRAALVTTLAARPVPYLVYGAICATSFLLFLGALRDGGAGFVLTLRNTSILFATALGWALGERATARQTAGAVLVAAGATLLGVAR